VWESAIKKASGRSWDKLYTVLSGLTLLFYKDQKHAKADPRAHAKGHTSLDLAGATVQRATDYTKRPHVIRLRLANGGEFLFQARDEDDATVWLNRLGAVCATQAATAAISATLPASSSGSKGGPSSAGQSGTSKR
jgi:spectrin beta